MGLRFLADHCVSNSIIQSLREGGHEVIRLRDVLPANSPDPAVIQRAQDSGAILLSLNGDFADIVTYPPGRYCGIVALQVRNRPQAIPLIVARLAAYLENEPDGNHYRGKLIVVEADRIRIRE